VNDIGRFYKTQDQSIATHLALSWKGRVRYTVPRDSSGRRACWGVFHPGRLELPLRAMARLPHLLGAVACAETEDLTTIRKGIGEEAGLSCCRAGAQGAWQKDSILLLNKRTNEPLYLVKAGAVAAVGPLLQNEADWLRRLRDVPSLVGRIPELVSYRSGPDMCFVAQTSLAGELDFRLGESQFDFLRGLQESSLQTKHYEDSEFCRTIDSRISDLSGCLSDAWSSRLQIAARRVKQSLSQVPILVVAAHNDFTPWNIRLKRGVALVFDWEFAAYEQLPLFDPLHFALTPMALSGRPIAKMIERMQGTLQHCRQSFKSEFCYEAQTQALAYLVNICTLYLWAEGWKVRSKSCARELRADNRLHMSH
jgi:hypothetical protein